MATDGATDDPVDVLMRSAHDVATVAPSVAIELYARARSLMAVGDARRIDAEIACLEPLARAGDIDIARRRADELLVTFSGDEAHHRIHAALGAVLATAGDLRSSAQHYAAAGAADAVAHGLHSGQQVLLGDDPGRVADELEHVLVTTTDSHVACAAHQGLALAAGARCDFERAEFHALESFRRFDPRTMPRDGFLMPDVWIGSFRAFADGFDDAVALFERVGYEAERRGELATLVHTSAALGLVALFNDRPDDAAREFDSTLAISAEAGAQAHLVTAHAGLAALAHRQGDRAAGDAHLAAGHDAMRSGLHRFGVDVLLWTTATAAADAGDVDDAFATLWQLWQLTATMRGLTQFRSYAPLLVKLAVQTGHDDEAATVVAELDERANATSVPSAHAAARRARALLARDGRALSEAADLLATTPWQLDAEAARAEAADLGSGVRPEAMAAPLARLSPRERDVVELVSGGLSNLDIAQQLFISRRTVESHVASAIRKLGASNRTQLATLAIRHSE